MEFDIEPASDYPLPDLVEWLNRSFENYFVPIQFNVPAFLGMLRKDSVDLSASRVLFAGEEPAGIALIARRGWTSRIAAMGISAEMRGKGAGTWLLEKLLLEARQRDDHEIVLEVIEQNQPAIRLYQKYGFQTIRRLIGLVYKDVSISETSDLQEMDLRQVGRLISQYGVSDLPWQLSAETIGQMTPPVRAYRKGPAYAVVANPSAAHMVIWSLLVEPPARGNGLGVDLLKSLLVRHMDKTWHVPAVCPEEFVKVFERAGFERDDFSQWQMRLIL